MWKRAIFAAIVVSLMGAAAYASFFIAPTERTMGTLSAHFLFSCRRGMGWDDGIFRSRFVANLALCVAAAAAVGFARRFVGRSGARVHHDGADHRADLGASRRGGFTGRGMRG